MGAWFARFWNDEGYFTYVLHSGGRFAVIGLGMALDSGLIPTGIDNGGKHLGPLVMFASALIGRRDPKPPKE